MVLLLVAVASQSNCGTNLNTKNYLEKWQYVLSICVILIFRNKGRPGDAVFILIAASEIICSIFTLQKKQPSLCSPLVTLRPSI